MSDSDLALQDLQHIRTIMSRTARFVSFSGYSAILIGLLWITAMLFTRDGLDTYLFHAPPGRHQLLGELQPLTLRLLGLFLASFFIGFIATYREARSTGEGFITIASLRIAFALALHLLVGAALGFAILQYSIYLAVAIIPLMYGLLLLNLSRYSRHDIQPLGAACIGCGLWACYTGQIWLAFFLSFGLAHLLYGIWVELAKRRQS